MIRWNNWNNNILRHHHWEHHNRFENNDLARNFGLDFNNGLSNWHNGFGNYHNVIPTIMYSDNNWV